MTLQVLALTRYGLLGASSRMRTWLYLPALRASGISLQVQVLFDNTSLAERYKRGGYSLMVLMWCYMRRITTLFQRKHFDLLWIEKEALPWCPCWLERLLLGKTPYVLDYDDAVFHNYDHHRLKTVRLFFSRRLDTLMANASLVVCGNPYLAKRAELAGAKKVVIVPTVVDLYRYPLSIQKQSKIVAAVPRIVWIGSPSTTRYLQLLSVPLRALSKQFPFVLRVIGGEVRLPDVQVECFPWSEESEAKLISDCAIGVMPLVDSPWERGKCGYKLIQYMACGLPVVASPVGANVDIVQNNINGFLAEGTNEWISSLSCLLCDSELRLKMGLVGRKDVEEKYCLEVTAPKLENYLRRAASEATG